MKFNAKLVKQWVNNVHKGINSYDSTTQEVLRYIFNKCSMGISGFYIAIAIDPEKGLNVAITEQDAKNLIKLLPEYGCTVEREAHYLKVTW